jgi:methyltransferase (TIGR00027 family)
VLEEGRIFRDPLALRILGDDADRVVEDARASPRRTLMRIFIAVRHRVAEDALARHVAAGTRQVVVLGAGLDTFAYRNPFADTGIRVFEVDHPATQEWKRDTLARTGVPIPDSVVYAPVDFEADDLATRMAASGVDLAAPTFFLWLGVVPYLTRAAVDATLQVVAAVPGAGVAFDYPNPVDQLSDRSREAHQARADRMRQLGEPWITYFDTDELADHLTGLGLRVVDDVGANEIGVRWFGRSPDEAPRGGAHVVVATTRPDPASA